MCLHSGLCSVAVLLSSLLILLKTFLFERHQNDSSLLLSSYAHLLLAGDLSALRTGTLVLSYHLFSSVETAWHVLKATSPFEKCLMEELAGGCYVLEKNGDLHHFPSVHF